VRYACRRFTPDQGLFVQEREVQQYHRITLLVEGLGTNDHELSVRKGRENNKYLDASRRLNMHITRTILIWTPLPCIAVSHY
jgi:hypothetical protein